MPLRQDECVTTIRAHSRALADVAEGNLDADVEFCPGWTVRDLVQHVTQVHWFWATIVEGRLSQPPEDGRPDAVDDDSVVEAFRTVADRLVRVLAEADPAEGCWTWAPAQQDVGFVIRHQVQEIVVHHWDAARAADERIEVAPEVGADSVDEFLHFSVSTEDDPADTPAPPLGSAFALASTDVGAGWLVTDAPTPGTLRISTTVSEPVAAPAVRGSATALLLWLYGRQELDSTLDADTSAVDAADPGLLARFRALCFTD